MAYDLPRGSLPQTGCEWPEPLQKTLARTRQAQSCPALNNHVSNYLWNPMHPKASLVRTLVALAPSNSVLPTSSSQVQVISTLSLPLSTKVL